MDKVSNNFGESGFRVTDIHKSLDGFGFSIGSVVLPLFGRWRVSSDAGSVFVFLKNPRLLNFIYFEKEMSLLPKCLYQFLIKKDLFNGAF